MNFENRMNNSIFDVAIIGGGPAGLSAAIYTARSKLKTLVMDKNPAAGALGRSRKIENYPGLKKGIPGLELLSIFKRQAESFGAEFKKTKVIKTNLDDKIKELYTSEGIIKAYSVIIATGSMGRKPDIKGESDFLGRGVSYCAECDAPFFNKKNVAITGLLNQIFDELDLIIKFAKKIYIITERQELSNEKTDLLKSIPKIKLLADYKILEIKGDEFVNSIIVSDPNGRTEQIYLSGIFIYLYGSQPVVDFLENEIKLTDQKCIKVDKNSMATSIKGVFAAGDVTCSQHRQAIISAAEGCISALSAERYLNKREKTLYQWTNMNE